MSSITDAARAFGQIQQNLNKAEFETRFRQVERGLIQQLEKETDAVIENNDVSREIDALNKQRDDLVDRIDNLKAVQFDQTTNANRFLNIRDQATAAVAAADADGNATLSAEELSALNTAISEIKEEVFKLNATFDVAGLTDGNSVNFLKQEIAALEALTAVEGTIDADGSGSPTNDNRSILDTLTSIASRSNTYADTATFLVGSLNQLIIDSNTKAFDLDADITQKSVVEIERQQQEIAELEDRYTNLIRSISLAFEVQSGTADLLAAGTEFVPPQGSILNLFT